MSANYTEAQEALLNAEPQPITYARAGELAEEMGKKIRSVIAKIQSMELAYERKPVEPKRPKGKTKAELVAEIEAYMGAEEGTFSGLDKATGQALGKFLEVANL